MTKKSIIYYLCVLSAAGVAGCGAGEASVGEVPETEVLMPVEVVLPESMDMFETFETAATIESDAEGSSVAPDVTVPEGDAEESPDRRVPVRHVVYTARYRLVLKGPDRGKWELDIRDEADAPLVTVDAVVRGVQRRIGDIAEVERMTPEQLAVAISDTPWKAGD